jgi:hypothetical protein
LRPGVLAARVKVIAVLLRLCVGQEPIHRANVTGETSPRLGGERLWLSDAPFRVAPEPWHDTGEDVHLVGTGGLVVLVDVHLGGHWLLYNGGEFLAWCMAAYDPVSPALFFEIPKSGQNPIFL